VSEIEVNIDVKSLYELSESGAVKGVIGHWLMHASAENKIML